MTFYCIRNKKNKTLLRFSVFSNDGADFCNAVGARFETGTSDYLYVATSEKNAQNALLSDPDWYNASIEHPQWPSNFNPDDYEVFPIDI